jgi:hypothetical protein
MAELKQRLEVLTSTDMAVIVSPGQNEIAADARRWGSTSSRTASA